jgi:hypothetical protein
MKRREERPRAQISTELDRTSLTTRKRLASVGIKGVSLPSYHHVLAERAKAAGHKSRDWSNSIIFRHFSLPDRFIKILCRHLGPVNSFRNHRLRDLTLPTSARLWLRLGRAFSLRQVAGAK